MLQINLSALPSLKFLGLAFALAALFFMGGSSRSDVQSLVVLNPVMIFCCAIAVSTLKKEHWQEQKWLLIGFGLIFLLVAFYLLPIHLQSEKFSSTRSDIGNIRVAADVFTTAKVMAVEPNAAWQSLFSLFAPLAVLLFAIQLNHKELQQAMIVIILVGAISGTIGVLQLIGSSSGPLYFYRITNNGSAVGLFANRNHSAVFLACLFPMLALFSARLNSVKARSFSQIGVIAVAIILVPLILVTGSRSGLIVAFVGLVGGLMLYKSQISADRGSKRNKASIPVVAVLLLVGLIFATIYFSRATAINRVLTGSTGAIDRSDFWTSSLKLFWEYFPFGVGPGSFAAAFQKQESLALLNEAYLNRLHNDWLETIISFGVPGLLLLTYGLAYFIKRTFFLWVRADGGRPCVAFGRMASIIVTILAIASFSDYPLRTPAMMGLAALVFVWFTDDRHGSKNLSGNC